MARRSLVIADLRGGRNGTDPPDALPDNQAVEMLNVDNFTGLLANKRNGASAVTESGGTAFSSGIQSLFRFVPGSAETAAELWGIDGAATPIVKRMASGTTFANVTLSDAIGQPHNVVAVTFNGKLFMAYEDGGAVDRLHCYDPLLSSPRVRRVGFATPAAPSVANTGAGAYAATLRYYRVRWVQKSGTTVIRLSKEGASQSFTPSGAGTAARVTQPAVPSEQETHWRVEVSLDNVTFYVLSDVVIATTTYDDSASTTTYSSNDVSAVDGEYDNWSGVRYLLTDGNRLLGAGSWESTGKFSRVWFSPVLGTTDEGDDERVPNTETHSNWVDLNENDGGAITGLGGPVYGAAYAFKYRQVWKLNPTGEDTTPYLPRKLSDIYGAINHKSIVVGRDAVGNPALYFLSPDGPCVVLISEGAAAVRYIGRPVEDIWATVNLAATTVVSHGVYHASKHQVWFWVATGSSNDPDTKIVYDVLRGSWYKHTGNSAGARCSVMFSNTLAASMSRDLKPYIGRASGTAIWKTDDGSVLDDAGTDFQAYFKTKPLRLAPLGQNLAVGQTVMVAKTLSGVTLTQTLDRDYGLETRTSTALLTAAGAETRVIVKFQASDLAQAGAVQVQIGDGAAQEGAWSVDLLEIPIFEQEWR